MSPGQTDVSSNTKLGAQTFPRLRCDGVHFDNAGSAKLWSFKESVNGQTMRRRDHPDLKSFHPKFPTTCSKHHLTGQGFLQVSYICIYVTCIALTYCSDCVVCTMTSL